MGGTVSTDLCSGEQPRAPFGCKLGYPRGGDSLMSSLELDAAPISEPMDEPETNSRHLETVLDTDVSVPMDSHVPRALSKCSTQEELLPSSHVESCCVLVLGISSVGKTTFVHTVLNGVPPGTLRTSVPTEFRSRLLPFEAENVTHLRLNVFDCNGTVQGFKAAKALSLRANAYVLCFDLTDADSFDALQDEYIHLIPESNRHKAIVVGIKADLADKSRRAIKRSQLVAFEEDEDVLCTIEVSCIPSENGRTQRMFLEALKKVRDVEGFESSSKAPNQERSSDYTTSVG